MAMRRWSLGVVTAPVNDGDEFSNHEHFDICDCPYPVQVIKPHHLDAHIVFNAPCGPLHLVTLPTGASITNINTGKQRRWVQWDTLTLKRYLIKEFERPTTAPRPRKPGEPSHAPTWASKKEQKQNPLLRAWHWFKAN